MKAWIRNRMVIAAVALLLAACLLSIGVTALAQGETNTGIRGLKGPTFTFGVVLGGSSGSESGVVPNGSPYALTGYVMSRSPGSVHIWIGSCSQALLDLGYKPGDIVTILCSETQIENIHTGDWVQITGFVVNGQLAFSGENTLPAPFGY